MSCAMEREIPSIHETLEDRPLPDGLIDTHSLLTWGCELGEWILRYCERPIVLPGLQLGRTQDNKVERPISFPVTDMSAIGSASISIILWNIHCNCSLPR